LSITPEQMAALEPTRDEILADLDPGIRPAVVALWKAGYDTDASCQGGEGHGYVWPVITLGTSSEDEALAAFRLLIGQGFPADTLHKAWHHCPDCYPDLSGPAWEIIFLKGSCT